MIVNDELARVWKEAIMACFKALSQHFSTGTEKYYEKTSDRIVNLETKILTLDLPNTNECYHAVSKLGPKYFICENSMQQGHV
jgi:hypothetical protein